MDVTFSDKYKPLFQLLEAWNVTKSPTFQKDYTKEEQENWIKLSLVDTVLMSGGRDSGKSFSLSCFNGVAAKDYNHRILYTRQTMSSTDNSITEALENRLELLNISQYFEVANKIYSVKKGIGKISITGQKTSVGTQTAKLKSLEGFSIFETDEGEELESFESWNKTKRSMRAQDVQCLSIISFNPPTREHWMFDEFYEDVEEGFNGIIGNTLYIHTTYLDNGKDNMAEHNWREYEELRIAYEEYESLSNAEIEVSSPKLKKKHKKYKFEILGGFKDIAEGVIYEDWDIKEFPDNLTYCYGLDFGSNDPDALTKVAIDRREMTIYIKEVYFKNNTGAPQLMVILNELVGVNDLIIADSTEKRLISDLYNGMHGANGEYYPGVNIRKVRKKKGPKDNFVKYSIKTCQGYHIIIDPDSKNLIKAIKNYVWHEKRAGVPNHNWSDLMDSWRYAAIDLLDYN